ncbi:MAG: hypothetical protein GY820_38750 [Gammaproteobacteria bacterium]|nr:hypothetical protein [Gammaproteobacteria bacterium]
MDNSRAGILFNFEPDGLGCTAYNNTGGQLKQGDVAYLTYGGTAGQEYIATYPAAASSPTVYALIALEDIAYQAIGKFAMRGTVDAMVNGTTDVAIGDWLECIAEDGVFDGTDTNLGFTKGSGSTADVIDDSDDGLVTDVFVAGAHVFVSGATSSSNNTTHTIALAGVAIGGLTLTTTGALTTEDGITGTVMKMQGILEQDAAGAATRSTGSIAIAKEAWTTNAAGLKKVFMHGEKMVFATS